MIGVIGHASPRPHLTSTMSHTTGTSFVAYVVDLPKTQDATRIPADWNTQWENLCAKNAFSPEICLAQAMSNSHVSSRWIFDQYSTLLQTARQDQYRIGVAGLTALEELAFAQRWKSASVQERRKHVLVGLSEACAIARNLNDARMYCGDVLKLRYLSQDPQVLLNLLTDIIPDDFSVISKEPYFIPNLVWDNFKSKKERDGMTDLEKIYIAEAIILRTKLICKWTILLVRKSVAQSQYLRLCCRFYCVIFLGERTSHNYCQEEP